MDPASPRRGTLAGGAPSPGASARSPPPPTGAGWMAGPRRSFKRVIGTMLPGASVPVHPATPPRPQTSPGGAGDDGPMNDDDAKPSPPSPPAPARPTRPPAGLSNLGDTCYFNAVVQVLFHTPRFRSALMNFRRHAPDASLSEDAGGVEGDIVAGLYNVFRALEEPGGYSHVDPSELVDVLRDRSRDIKFDADGQQDAHEFLRFLLDCVGDAFGRAAKVEKEQGGGSDGESGESAGAKRSAESESDETRARKRARIPAIEEEELDESDIPPPSGSGSMSTPIASTLSSSPPSRFLNGSNLNRALSALRPPSTSPSKRPRATTAHAWNPDAVRSIFGGEMVTSTRCAECETASLRPEAFLDLSVPVSVGRSLSGSLSAMTAGDMLCGRDKYACETCHTKTEAERRLYLSKVPPVLTIHLKLFQFTATMEGAKIPVSTPCPMRMRFQRWCTKSCGEKAGRYELTGIIVHAGGCSTSGHYYAYVKVHGRWFLFDDSNVAGVEEEEIKEALFSSVKSKKTGYLLFYSAVDDD